MIIANPIYDVVFKLLMSDLDVAKGFISRIMGREILRLSFSSQEVPLRTADHEGQTITLLRMDFAATVLDEHQRETQVLIEIQKAKIPEDIGRFRNYLGEQYKGTIDHKEKNISISKHLPIFTIYLLNFNLNSKLPALIRVQREYRNAVTQQALKPDIHDEFIECLTHDSFIAQVTKLPLDPQEPLERAFALFNQKLIKGKDHHKLYLDDGTELRDDELLQKMLRILSQAVAKPEVARQMEHEDILQKDLEMSMRKLEVKIAEMTEQKEEERRQKEEERRQKEEERRQKEEAQARIAGLYDKLCAMGMSEAEALSMLNLTSPPKKH